MYRPPFPFLFSKFLRAYKSLNTRQRCIFDNYLMDRHSNYKYSDIAKICWPERKKPVTDSMVAIEVRKIRLIFEEIILEDDH